LEYALGLSPESTEKRSVIRAHDGKPVTHDSLPIRIAEQIRDLLNEAGVELDPLPERYPAQCFFADAERTKRNWSEYFDAQKRASEVIMTLQRAKDARLAALNAATKGERIALA
jgi:hypothetical protein